ncbi:hypothetical protein AKJ16_DCAP26202 [Drosera capensis]
MISELRSIFIHPIPHESCGDDVKQGQNSKVLKTIVKPIATRRGESCSTLVHRLFEAEFDL